MEMMLIYDVIIPVYRPDEKLKRLINALLSQSLLPRRIILINTGISEIQPGGRVSGTEPAA